MSSITYQKLDHRLANLEGTLNTLGYIPGVSTLSGTCRGVYGGGESVVGKVVGTLKSCQYLITGNREHRNEAAAAFWYGAHGDANLTRASIEALPGILVLTGAAFGGRFGGAIAAVGCIGNLSTFLYDKAIALRMNYTFEHVPSNKLPILDPSKGIHPEKLHA